MSPTAEDRPDEAIFCHGRRYLGDLLFRVGPRIGGVGLEVR